MVLEELFCGKHCDKAEQELMNITKPDQLLFSSRVENNKLPNDFVSRIFQPLVNQFRYLTDFEYTKNGKYNVKKNPQHVHSNPIMPKEIIESLSITNKIKRNTLHYTYSPIENPELLINKIELTCELYDELKKNTAISHLKSRFENIESIRLIDELLSFPLVGSIRLFPDQTVLYLLSYYGLRRHEELEALNIQLDHVLPNILKSNTEFRKIVQESAKLCRPNGGYDCYITKMLCRPHGSTGVCVVYFISFLKDIKTAKQDKLPLKILADYVQKELQWEVYLKHLSYKKITLPSEMI
jgi:hypothetical protein